MGGGKGGSAPKPIDPGKSAGEFLFGKDFKSYGGITDPRLQERLLQAEGTYRPRYTAQDLANQEQFLFGTTGGPNQAYEDTQKQIANLEQLLSETDPQIDTGGSGRRYSRSRRGFIGQPKYKDNPAYTDLQRQLTQKRAELAGMSPDGGPGQAGLLDILSRATPEISRIQSDAASIQRERDIEDVTRLLPEVMQAQREADPAQYQLYDSLMDNAQTDIDSARRLDPEERRLAIQTAREGATARGRGMDNAALFDEAMNRQQFQDQREDRARAFGQSMLQAGELVNADPFLTILGRPSGAAQMAQGQQLIGNDMMNNLGPALFDPNTGLNIAMADSANQANYKAAQAGASGSMMGGLMGGIGAAVGGIFSDRRLKHEIVRVGTHPLGIGIYAYRYKGLPGRHIGVMAQEVQAVRPEAVGEQAGFLTVDYSKL